ncbi:MAG: hypothetical protein Q9193_002918, partial [Seirophora villosa]
MFDEGKFKPTKISQKSRFMIQKLQGTTKATNGPNNPQPKPKPLPKPKPPPKPAASFLEEKSANKSVTSQRDQSNKASSNGKHPGIAALYARTPAEDLPVPRRQAALSQPEFQSTQAKDLPVPR